jgi:hypothetical protein
VRHGFELRVLLSRDQESKSSGGRHTLVVAVLGLNAEAHDVYALGKLLVAEIAPLRELVKVAATINAAKHPSNLNLQPVEEVNGEFPQLAERNDGKHKVVLLKLPARIGDSGEDTTLTFALVYEGTGQI